MADPQHHRFQFQSCFILDYLGVPLFQETPKKCPSKIARRASGALVSVLRWFIPESWAVYGTTDSVYRLRYVRSSIIWEMRATLSRRVQYPAGSICWKNHSVIWKICCKSLIYCTAIEVWWVFEALMKRQRRNASMRFHELFDWLSSHRTVPVPGCPWQTLANSIEYLIILGIVWGD